MHACKEETSKSKMTAHGDSRILHSSSKNENLKVEVVRFKSSTSEKLMRGQYLVLLGHI